MKVAVKCLAMILRHKGTSQALATGAYHQFSDTCARARRVRRGCLADSNSGPPPKSEIDVEPGMYPLTTSPGLCAMWDVQNGPLAPFMNIPLHVAI